MLPDPVEGARLDLEYVLPLRWTRDDPEEREDLTAYLAALSALVDVTVVDATTQPLRAAHERAWSSLPRLRHVRPAPRPGRNGKVAGVVTGVRLARHERVVVADDDVRWAPPQLHRAHQLLDDADLVRPQNVFTGWPWHARWDGARALVNRALAHDHPGTYALRRSALLATDGYDGDVLFENLELERTLVAAGGRLLDAPDLLVGRRPPTTRQFLGQRVRQAYDSLAQPPRLAVEAALLPAGLLLGTPRRLLAASALAVALAEAGRRRHGSRTAFPATAALWAPAWVAERAVASWAALAWWAVGGVPYAGGRLRRAATPARVLRDRHRNSYRDRYGDAVVCRGPAAGTRSG